MGTTTSNINEFGQELYCFEEDGPSPQKTPPRNEPLVRSISPASASPIRLPKSHRILNVLKRLSPLRNRRAAPSKYKTFHFYFEGISYDMKVYCGTPLNLIWRTLFTKIGLIQKGLDFDKLVDNVSIRDSLGSALVFSPDHIPTEEILYVEFLIPLIQPDMVILPLRNGLLTESKDRAFCWDEEWNNLYCGYGLSEGNRKIYAERSTLSRCTSLPVAISNRSFTKGSGAYKWRVIFNDKMMGNKAGIISEDEISFPRKCSTFGNYLPSIPWFYKTSNQDDQVITIILDMDKLELTVNEKLIQHIPDKVYAGVCFNNSSKIEAILSFY